jgi:acetyl-CoA carboxylase carboxyl transferase subunit alpha
VPIVVVVIGEGGSGGALGIGVGDRVGMMENAYYSVISPEGCAAILWKTGEKAEEAAAQLKLTAADLERLGIVDEVIPEPLGGAHRNPEQAAASLRQAIVRALDELADVPLDTLLEARYAKFRRIGAHLF